MDLNSILNQKGYLGDSTGQKILKEEKARKQGIDYFQLKANELNKTRDEIIDQYNKEVEENRKRAEEDTNFFDKISKPFTQIASSAGKDPLGTAVNVGRAVAGDPTGLIKQGAKATGVNLGGLENAIDLSKGEINTDKLLDAAKDKAVEYGKSKLTTILNNNPDTQDTNQMSHLNNNTNTQGTNQNFTHQDNGFSLFNNTQNSIKNLWNPELYKEQDINTDRLNLLKQKLYGK